MNSRVSLLAVACLAGSAFALASNEVQMFGSSATIQAMEKVFLRSERAHQSSMAAITKSLTTTEKALDVLRAKNMSSPALVQVAEATFGRHHRLRAPPAGYSGISGAKSLLNDMIFESSTKYDAEIAKCTEFYSSQCGLLTQARGEISASNYIAANSRMSILNSQGTINRCEEDIPTRKLELKDHNRKCKNELSKMNYRLKIILGDIAVMTMILKMTDCEKKLLQQQELGLLRCDDCTGKSFISFKHDGLKHQISQLQASSQQVLNDVMADLFDGVENLQQVEFHAVPNISKTQFNNPPLPRTEVPGNPCNDPHQGAPSPETKRAAKCTIGKSPQCYKLQERFLLIQSGIMDDRDALLEEIQKMESACEEIKNTLETQIANDESMLGNAQTKLAAATEDEANAGEKARQTAKQFNGMSADLVAQMKTCNTNYINFETELCALKKIRGELYKMQGGGAKKSFFVDCSVTKWDMEECNKKCGGGSQKLVRGIITHPNGGAKCLPLSAVKNCNFNPCPVNCRLHQWSGWSKCSAQCGGGVTQRLRDVERAMKFGGKPCGATSETKACNAQACEKDCELGKWSPWGQCSKDCDGGTQKREKFVKVQAVGDGTCPDEWSPERLEYRPCNMHRCKVDTPKDVLKCNTTLDVVLLIDGSGSLGKDGWNAEIEAAKLFISAFSEKAKMAVFLFSGPKTWSGVKKCVGKSKEPVDMEKCGIVTVSHFTDELKKVDQLVTGLEFPQGSTLTSLALSTAKAELALGRKDAKAVVVVFTDGRPLSFRKTWVAARDLRKQARLMWVPITKRAPLGFIKKLATRRWQENVVLAKDYEILKKPETVTHLIADMCPAPKPPMMTEIMDMPPGMVLN